MYELKITDLPTIPYFPVSSHLEWTDFRYYGLRSATAYVLVFDLSNQDTFQVNARPRAFDVFDLGARPRSNFVSRDLARGKLLGEEAGVRLVPFLFSLSRPKLLRKNCRRKSPRSRAESYVQVAGAQKLSILSRRLPAANHRTSRRFFTEAATLESISLNSIFLRSGINDLQPTITDGLRVTFLSRP